MRLTWADPSPPTPECHYNHTISETPFGRFLLTWKGWKEYPDYGFDETPWGEGECKGWNSVEDAQEWASQEMQRRVKLCLSQD
jgi:hypothetical protein